MKLIARLFISNEEDTLDYYIPLTETYRRMYFAHKMTGYRYADHLLRLC